ncbi:hypothetical protein [Hymenobacter sp. IS2118]|uniref:hypothetical protein n=1 Tax=Hymenobacter sp. IS2118 TaxID=1505605 RepID=UPI000553AC10|nr:hypothetical protein [Hymenobacter sp. IS2118]
MKKLLLPGCLLLSLAACKKDDPESSLPKASQEGKNTAGWLFDGKAWVPKSSSISTGRPVNGSWRKTRGGRSLSLGFHQFSIQEDWAIGFFLPDIRQAGTFVLNQVPAITSGLNNTGYGQFNRQRPNPRFDYYTGPDAPGRLIITRFDTVNNIVSGTFEMSPREVSTNAGITITQGRFDLRFER